MNVEKLDLSAFAKRIRDLRQERGVSAMTVGLAIGISDTTIISWENEKYVPKLDTAFLVSRYFGVSMDYLCGLRDY